MQPTWHAETQAARASRNVTTEQSPTTTTPNRMPDKAGAKTAASGVPTGLVGQKARTLLRKRLGEDVYTSWFNAIEFDSFENGVVVVSVPVKFLRNWIQTHYISDLLECCQAEFKGAEKVDVKLRQPRAATPPPVAPVAEVTTPAKSASTSSARPMSRDAVGTMTGIAASIPQLPQPGRTTKVGDFEGSPLDPRYTFDTFVVGSSNRVAHAAATRVAESVGYESPGFNPLFIHSPVGLGKSHLLQAAAWEVTRRRPDANVLYLTADGFRYRFVEALRSEDPLSFKEKFRKVDILLIDDLEFMHGAQTETEFDHIVNALLDGGRQLVVASSRPPAQIERLNERMRSRLARGLVTELGTFDYEHRISVIEMRIAEKRVIDATFNLSRDVVELLADKLKDNGRELEGAVIRLFANWQYVRAPITVDVAETVIRDLVQGLEPRRIKIEDILRVISRHFGVSKTDLLSQRRHRSVVWPRQIGMFLAKQMTARSLPEIGRRFGNRDHTTVLHAIRKIDGELNKNPRLRDELDDLKKQLNN